MRYFAAALCSIVASAGALASPAFDGPPIAAPRVEVQSRDGRMLRGGVDDRTDEDHLWIRRDESTIVMAASVAWQDIVAATIDGQPVTPEDLAARRDELQSSAPEWFSDEPQRVTPVPAPPQTLMQRAGAPGAHRVRSLQITSACLVNFDRDVEPDGLQLTLVAVGFNGLPVAVRGSLSAQLFGQRQSSRDGQSRFGILDRWSQPVRPSDFIDGAVTYELPFRRTSPEWDFALLPDAVLSVQLGAFGEGNFAASAPVLMREFNPLRDNLQLHARTRFAPHELHSRDPVSAPRRDDGLWLHWTR